MRKPPTSDPSTHRIMALTLCVSPREMERIESRVAELMGRQGRHVTRSAAVWQLILDGEQFLDA